MCSEWKIRTTEQFIDAFMAPLLLTFENISHFIYIHTNCGCHDKMLIKIYINNKTINLSFGKNENRHQSENNVILW